MASLRRVGQRCADVEPGIAEAHEVLVAGAARAAEQLEVIDRLEQVRLAVAVVTEQRDARRGEGESGAIVVPEAGERERADAHQGHGRRGGR
jgi:hypothetical protein